MLNKYFSSISNTKKVFIAIFSVAVLSQIFMAILALSGIYKNSYIAQDQADKIGSEASSKSLQVLKQQSKEHLTEFASLAATASEQFLGQIPEQILELSSNLESDYVQNSSSQSPGAFSSAGSVKYIIDSENSSPEICVIYNDKNYNDENVYHTTSKKWQKLSQTEKTEVSSGKIVMLDTAAPEQLNQELNFISNILPNATKIIENNPNVLKIKVATKSGTVYQYRASDTCDICDVRSKQWYQSAITSDNSIWNENQNARTNTTYLTCAKAYRDKKGNVLGVVAIDISAKNFKNYILNPINNYKNIVFITDTAGNVKISAETNSEILSDKSIDLSELYKKIIINSLKKETGISDFIIDNKNYISAYCRVNSLPLYIFVAKKFDFSSNKTEFIKESVIQYIENLKSAVNSDTSTIVFQFLILAAVFSIVIYALCTKLANKLVLELNSNDEKIKKIEAELDMAKKIQKSMMPQFFPEHTAKNDLEIYALTSPAGKVGGDFYDFFFLDRDRLAVVIADASDKGVPAALFMAETKNLIKTHLQIRNSLVTTLEFVNKTLCENNETRMFVTVFAAIIDIKSGNMEFVNAGHTPPLVYRSSNQKFDFVSTPHCCALGANEKAKYHTSEMPLQKNDAIVLYTDGITETTNSNNELFSGERLKWLVNNNDMKNLPIKDLLIEIQKSARDFSESNKPSDDTTMLGLRKL